MAVRGSAHRWKRRSRGLGAGREPNIASVRFKPRKPGSINPNNEVWPDGLPGTPGSRFVPVFVPRPPLRKLRVVIDADVLDRIETPDADEPDSLLASLVHDKYISLLRYADEGPSAEEIAKGTPSWPGTPNGWVIGPRGAPPAGSGGGAWVRFALGGPGGQIMGYFHGAQYAAEDSGSGVYSDRPPEEAATRRAADVVAASCAYAVGADLFITERPYLFRAAWDAAVGVLAIRPFDALPLVGLYLRAQEQFTVREAYGGLGGGINMNRGGFYTAATYDLLPSLGRWYGACEAHCAAVGDNDLVFLAGSLVHRFQRALQDRDRVWFSLNRPTMGESGEDALDALDDVLLRLMGAVDVTARVARFALGLDESLRLQGWTSKQFRREVRKVAPPLADLFAPETDNRRTLDVLARLRNTIHHTALPEIRITEGRGSHRTWIGLRTEDSELVLEAADALGGRQAWGVNESAPNEFLLDPGRVADQLAIHTAKLIVAVQDATPVERLTGVTPGDAVDLTSPLDGFGIDAQMRVRLQLGLGTDSD